MKPDENEIARLLQLLHSDLAIRRKMAVDELAALDEKSDEVIQALETMAAQDPDKYIRQAALRALERGPSPKRTPSRREPSRREKMIDFAIGFVGWCLVNGLIWFNLTGGTNDTRPGYTFFYNLLIFPANLLVLIVLAWIKRTRKIALGILVALALNFTISLVLGVGWNGVCFLPFYLKF